MVVKGVIEEEHGRQRIAALKAQRLQIEAELASLEEAPKFIALHPATLDRYAETVDALAASLGDHDEAEDDRGPLVRSFRALVHSVTIHPNGPREGFQIEVKGKLAALIGGDPRDQILREMARLRRNRGGCSQASWSSTGASSLGMSTMTL